MKISLKGCNSWNYDTFEKLFISISGVVNDESVNLDNSIADSLTFQIVTEQQYVDLGDLDNVIKPLYAPLELISFLTGHFKSEIELGIEKNEINLEDNWWEILSLPEKIKFNTIQFLTKQTSRYSIRENFILINVILKGQTNQFGRKVLGVLEVTGVVGGIFELFDILVGTLIGFIYSYMFKKELK